MNVNDLELLLKNTKYEQFIGFVNNVELKGHIYEDLFKIGSENIGYFALKIRENNKKYVLDSIKNISIIKDNEKFIHKNIDAIHKDNYIIMVSEWLYGLQPIDNNRKYLPKFFSLLANFNKQNKVNRKFTSMYVDGNYFDNIKDLIDWEIKYHKNYMQDIMETKEIIEILKIMEYGLSCVILEDMNTGNLIITNDGKYKFLDTEWIINGLNLYQFEKIDYFGFEERKWYNINEEAKDCYFAYFETLGIKINEANEQIKAFELLKVLRDNTYLKHFGKNNDEEIIKRINKVKEIENYI
jgi:hypothetical protein